MKKITIIMKSGRVLRLWGTATVYAWKLFEKLYPLVDITGAEIAGWIVRHWWQRWPRVE